MSSIMKVRKNCDHHFTELLFALVLKNPLIQFSEISNALSTIICPNSSKYIEDLNLRSEKEVNSYIDASREPAKKINNEYTIKDVYLCGKSTSKFPTIHSLNQGIDRKHAKADIYIESVDSVIVAGFSIKGSKNATLSNYSVEKILENGNKLKETKKNILLRNGFESFSKKDREQHNKLFYSENEYWSQLNEEIHSNKEDFLDKINSCLFPQDLKYDLWEFNGEKLINIFPSVRSSHLSIERIFPKNKDGSEKKAAKMWHKLQIGDIHFSSEIRWKGNIFHSPQIMIVRD